MPDPTVNSKILLPGNFSSSSANFLEKAPLLLVLRHPLETHNAKELGCTFAPQRLKTARGSPLHLMADEPETKESTFS